MISIKGIRCVIAIYRTGNFHEAAANLNISQASISMSIKRLEKSLDIKLFQRNAMKGRSELTKKGRGLIQDFIQINDQVNKLLEKISRLKNGQE